jgi:hypothetical protein
MHQLAAVFPSLQRVRRLPLSRDQFLLLLVVASEMFIGLEHYMAHSFSGTIVLREWIPIIYAPAAALLLMLTGLVAARRHPLPAFVGCLSLLGSVAVGLLGVYYHVVRAILPSGPPGVRVTLSQLVWAPPILGPLFLSLVGLLGVIALWREIPSGSGIFQLAGQQMRLPLSKTRVLFILVALGILAATSASVLDHARTHFENPWLWLPTAVGAFGTVVVMAWAGIEQPTRTDLLTLVTALFLLLAIGPLGLVLHVEANLVTQNAFVVERFLRGAPIFAPMLFTNMAMFGMVALLDPEEPAA